MRPMLSTINLPLTPAANRDRTWRASPTTVMLRPPHGRSIPSVDDEGLEFKRGFQMDARLGIFRRHLLRLGQFIA